MNQWIKEASDEDLYSSKIYNGLAAGDTVRTQLGDDCTE